MEHMYNYYTIIHFYNTANMRKRYMVFGHNTENDTTAFDKYNEFERNTHYIYRFDYVEYLTKEEMYKRFCAACKE